MENTGHNAIPVTTARKNGDDISWALSSTWFEWENEDLATIHIQICGNMYINPSIKRILPERYFQNDEGISIKRVLTLSKTVKNTIEKARESVTIYGYHFFFSDRDPANTTGRTGSTHGARIVRIHAKKEEMKSIIKSYVFKITNLYYELPKKSMWYLSHTRFFIRW